MCCYTLHVPFVLLYALLYNQGLQSCLHLSLQSMWSIVQATCQKDFADLGDDWQVPQQILKIFCEKTTWFQDRWRSPLPFVLVRFIMAPYCTRFFGSCLIDPFTTVYLECSNSAYSTKLGDFTHHTSGEFCESLITFPQKIQRPCQRMMGGGTITYSEEYFRIHYHSQKVIWSIINLQSSSESSNFQGFPFNEQQLSLSNFIFDKYRSQFLEC